MSDQARKQAGEEGHLPAPKRRIRVGFVGCGEVAQIMHWPSLYQLSDHFQVTALCDVSPMILEQLGKLWSIQTLTTDHRELVARSDVDVVLIANPNAFHAEVTIGCYRRRKARPGRKADVRHPPRSGPDRGRAEEKQRRGAGRLYAPVRAGVSGRVPAVKAMKEIKFARVRDFLGSNSLIIHPTSRVIRDEQLPESVKNDAKLRDEALMDEALGGNRRPHSVAPTQSCSA